MLCHDIARIRGSTVLILRHCMKWLHPRPPPSAGRLLCPCFSPRNIFLGFFCGRPKVGAERGHTVPDSGAVFSAIHPTSPQEPVSIALVIVMVSPLSRCGGNICSRCPLVMPGRRLRDPAIRKWYAKYKGAPFLRTVFLTSRALVPYNGRDIA